MIFGREFSRQCFCFIRNLAGSSVIQTNKSFAEGRFAGTAFANQTKDFILGNGQRDAIDCVEGLVTADVEIFF